MNGTYARTIINLDSPIKIVIFWNGGSTTIDQVCTEVHQPAAKLRSLIRQPRHAIPSFYVPSRHCSCSGTTQEKIKIQKLPWWRSLLITGAEISRTRVPQRQKYSCTTEQSPSYCLPERWYEIQYAISSAVHHVSMKNWSDAQRLEWHTHCLTATIQESKNSTLTFYVSDADIHTAKVIKLQSTEDIGQFLLLCSRVPHTNYNWNISYDTLFYFCCFIHNTGCIENSVNMISSKLNPFHFHPLISLITRHTPKFNKKETPFGVV